MSTTCIEPVVDVQSNLEDFAKIRDKELLIASREFAVENRALSWWHLSTTLLILGVSAYVAGFAEWMWVRSLGSLLTGLVIVRMFILYHDYQHHAILKNSKLAGAILCTYGHLVMAPPSVWKHTHDYHHHHNSKLFGLSTGTFPLMTTEDYRDATWIERLSYRFYRNPIVIALGYITVFMWGMSVRPLIHNPKNHLDSILSLVLHFGVMAVCVWLFGWTTSMFMYIVPIWIACAIGAYMFYAQHNFPGAKIRDGDEWTYTEAALKSSSFMSMGPVMHWLTGNIGYHHVHHLNSKIPFYRLHEAMTNLKALQAPITTTLKLRDVLGCLRLKLWDASQDCFVTFSEAKRNAATN